MAPSIGGTWYWYRYPGAMSDTESYLYRYSWDLHDLQSYPWPRRCLSQSEILAYLQHIVERHGLDRFIRCGVEMLSATWNEGAARWSVLTSVGETVSARYLIQSLGVLSQPHYPLIPGTEHFAGKIVHTSRWPNNLPLKDSESASSGRLDCGQRLVSGDERHKINQDYADIWDRVRNSYVGFGIKDSGSKATEATVAEREAAFREAWDHGNGFHFMFGAYGDLVTNKEANNAACGFLRCQIADLVKDTRKDALLTPSDSYARRPVCNSGYYPIFNQPKVDVVSVAETPIAQIVPQGVEMADGKVHKLDVLVFATGYDAVEGNYNRVKIAGVDGQTLSQHWADGPTAYGAVACAGFPAHSRSSRLLLSELELIMACIDAAEQGCDEAKVVTEALQDAETSWSETCLRVAKATLFWVTRNWIFGVNVLGREPKANFYLGGLGAYRAWTHEPNMVVNSSYKLLHLLADSDNRLRGLRKLSDSLQQDGSESIMHVAAYDTDAVFASNGHID
ncbi:hypothetical protein LTR17_025843 [Elasticomyces elasticus]|nr:hypothetical protein LTR17_025843 [Elasticomyces elasticus]